MQFLSLTPSLPSLPQLAQASTTGVTVGTGAQLIPPMFEVVMSFDGLAAGLSPPHLVLLVCFSSARRELGKLALTSVVLF